MTTKHVKWTVSANCVKTSIDTEPGTKRHRGNRTGSMSLQERFGVDDAKAREFEEMCQGTVRE